MRSRMSARTFAPLSSPQPDSWVDRWLAACGDLAELERTHPMTDAVIEEIDGRMIRVGDKWLADFASCNYLGFDLEQEIIDAVPAFLADVGDPSELVTPARQPRPLRADRGAAHRVAGLRGHPHPPTITLIHMSVIPVLAGGGTIFMDRRAHKTIYEGCQFAAARGASLQRFQLDDLDGLEKLLRADTSRTRLICIDGVNSMTGNMPDLHALARHGALVRRDPLRRRRPRLRCHRRTGR